MGTMGLAISSALGQSYAQNKALIAQGKANVQTAKNYTMSMNYSLQNLEQERQDAFEATIAELEKINLQGNRLTTSVEASVNEGLMGGGRTANLIKRSAQADVNRAVDSAKTNYQKKSNEIDLNKEAVALNTKNAISSIQNVESPSLFSTLLNIGTAYYGAKTTIESINGVRTEANATTNPSSAVNVDTDDAFATVVGSVNDPAVNFSFSNINPYDYYEPQKGRDL